MQKEKKIRTYQRRTKSGKLVTVKAHTAKYDAAEKAKEFAKKKGAGEEIEERKKKKVSQLEIPFDEDSKKDNLDEVKEAKKTDTPKKEKPSKEPKVKATKETKSSTKTKAEPKSKKAETSEPAFTAAEFKEWYNGTGSAADKKVAKALRAQLGRSGYKKLENEAIDNYSTRGHLKMFKSLGEMKGEGSKEAKSSGNKTSLKVEKPSKPSATKTSNESAHTDYGVAPKHLGVSQSAWNDWIEGGDSYSKADRAVKRHLTNLYGKDGAKALQKKYEGDGSNTYIELAESATPTKTALAFLGKLKPSKAEPKSVKSPKKTEKSAEKTKAEGTSTVKASSKELS